MSTLVAAAGSGRAMWYLTRGSGVVTLLLLTASVCLGVAGAVRLRTRRLPRFTVAALHRDLTLLAVVFLGIHVATTLADGYTPIGWKDAFVPFLSPYRPFWLGLGAVALDLLLALVITSLLRARFGLRTWRLVHWLAYACWPIALLHSLGTGSDPRAGWLQVLGVVSVTAVLLAVAARLVRSGAQAGRRLALGGAVAALTLLAGAWYQSGPGAPGWAARAGTPATLLHSATVITAPTAAGTASALPSTFNARLAGTLSETQAANGRVDLHVDGSLTGGLRGRLRFVLEGIPLQGGGVSMTASGVSFAARGSLLYQGRIVGLSGNQVSARLVDAKGHVVDLSLLLSVSESSNSLTGAVHGSVT
jgi:Ferric reductase like transmembrane component